MDSPHLQRQPSGSPTEAAPQPTVRPPPRKGSFHVTVIRAEGLCKRDKILPPQPFVSVVCQNQRFRTEAIKKTLDPEWETTFVISEVPEGTVVILDVLDGMRLPAMLDPKCFLGEITFRLSLAGPYSENAFLKPSKTYPESPPVTGTLWVHVIPIPSPIAPTNDRRTSTQSTPASDAPLPPGWERRQTADTGAFYWIDHQSGMTTWIDPLSAPGAQVPAETAPPYLLADSPALPPPEPTLRL